MMNDELRRTVLDIHRVYNVPIFVLTDLVTKSIQLSTQGNSAEKHQKISRAKKRD